jgi:hypothetical protein
LNKDKSKKFIRVGDPAPLDSYEQATNVCDYIMGFCNAKKTEHTTSSEHMFVSYTQHPSDHNNQQSNNEGGKSKQNKSRNDHHDNSGGRGVHVDDPTHRIPKKQRTETRDDAEIPSCEMCGRAGHIYSACSFDYHPDANREAPKVKWTNCNTYKHYERVGWPHLDNKVLHKSKCINAPDCDVPANVQEMLARSGSAHKAKNGNTNNKQSRSSASTSSNGNKKISSKSAN